MIRLVNAIQSDHIVMAVESRLKFLMEYSLASDIVLDLPDRFISTRESDVSRIVNNVLVYNFFDILLRLAPLNGILFMIFLLLILLLSCIFGDCRKWKIIEGFHVKAAAIVVELDLFVVAQNFGKLFLGLI